MKRPSIAVIGAGAAGCFAAARISRLLPEAEVTVYEGSSSPMAKLSVTGGGRCNLTNTFEGVRSLEEVYPRGSGLMKRLLKHFGPRETMEWFRNEGLPLTVLPDGRVFPSSNDARDVVWTLMRALEEGGVRVKTHSKLSEISTALNTVVTKISELKTSVDGLAPTDYSTVLGEIKDQLNAIASRL